MKEDLRKQNFSDAKGVARTIRIEFIFQIFHPFSNFFEKRSKEFQEIVKSTNVKNEWMNRVLNELSTVYSVICAWFPHSTWKKHFLELTMLLS